MFYSIRHLTRFRYATAVSESVTEARMHPRSEQNQRCLNFHLSVSPRCRLFSYRDYLGNAPATAWSLVRYHTTTDPLIIDAPVEHGITNSPIALTWTYGEPPAPGVTTLTDSRLTEEDAHPVDL